MNDGIAAATKGSRQKPDISWRFLLATTALITGSLYFVGYSVLYTEGEVMQGVFVLFTILAGGSVMIGFYRREIAMYAVVLLGGSLLLWQTHQIRKWAIIHEDIIGIIQFVEETGRKKGSYPKSLDEYRFKHDWVKLHIYGIGIDPEDGFRLTYFINDPGISYWYSAKAGFGYYPD